MLMPATSWRSWLPLAIVASLSCGEAAGPSRSAVARVVLTPDHHVVAVGGTLRLVAEPQDAKGQPVAGRKVFWTTRDPAIASVSADGLLTGVAVGMVDIAASVEGVSAVVAATVLK